MNFGWGMSWGSDANNAPPQSSSSSSHNYSRSFSSQSQQEPQSQQSSSQSGSEQGQYQQQHEGMGGMFGNGFPFNNTSFPFSSGFPFNNNFNMPGFGTGSGFSGFMGNQSNNRNQNGPYSGGPQYSEPFYCFRNTTSNGSTQRSTQSSHSQHRSTTGNMPNGTYPGPPGSSNYANRAARASQNVGNPNNRPNTTGNASAGNSQRTAASSGSTQQSGRTNGTGIPASGGARNTDQSSTPNRVTRVKRESVPEISVLPALRSEVCSICLTDFQEETKAIRLPCLHMFHPECCSEWLEEHQMCPVCKLDLHPSHIHRKLRFRIEEIETMGVKELKYLSYYVGIKLDPTLREKPEIVEAILRSGNITVVLPLRLEGQTVKELKNMCRILALNAATAIDKQDLTRILLKHPCVVQDTNE